MTIYYFVNFLGLSRPYPVMVAGKEISYKFDTEKNTFKLKFKPTDDSGLHIFESQATLQL